MYKRNDQFGDNKSSILYLAIVKFLTRIYPREFREVEYGLTRTQYMFILPEDYVHDKRFIEISLHPLLEEVPWLSTNECKAKYCLKATGNTIYTLFNVPKN